MRHVPLALFGVLFVLAFATFLAFPLPHDPKEPLADEESLSQLISGQTIPTPRDEPYGVFHNEAAVPPPLTTLLPVSRILGITAPDASSYKRIEVDLTRQHVYAFEGDRKVYDFVVSTGKWWATPTGTFTIWVKVRSQLMKGGSKQLGTYYYLPNVPYVMFFYNNQTAKINGFSLHGTYWHNNFGHPMSHGCVNMKIEDAQTLYDWATPRVTNPKAWSTLATAQNPGTKVIIYGTTPKE